MYLQDIFFHTYTHTEQTVLSTDKVVENHMIKVTAVFEYRVGCKVFAQWSRSYKSQAVWASTHTFIRRMCSTSACCTPTQTPRIPSLYLQNGSGSSWKTTGQSGFVHCSWHYSLTAGLLIGPDLKDEAHHQYKNIVQQFSCHSKHSYLSVNGPVISAAIQIKKKKKQKHNLLHKAKRKGGIDHIRGLQVLTHSKQIVYFASQQSTL